MAVCEFSRRCYLDTDTQPTLPNAALQALTDVTKNDDIPGMELRWQHGQWSGKLDRPVRIDPRAFNAQDIVCLGQNPYRIGRVVFVGDGHPTEGQTGSMITELGEEQLNGLAAQDCRIFCPRYQKYSDNLT